MHSIIHICLFILASAAGLDLNEYHGHETILNHLSNLELSNPRVSVIEMGMTHEGRPLRGIKIRATNESSIKPSIWIDAGIHAREKLSVSTALHLIHKILGGDITTDEYNWYIHAVVNPDGYDYALFVDSNWRKNRVQNSANDCIYCGSSRVDLCESNETSRIGVDLNRNFAFNFMPQGASNPNSGSRCPMDNVYTGELEFSELETHAMINFMARIPNLKSYVTLHTYSEFIMYPDMKFLDEAHKNDLNNVAQNIALAMSRVHKENYWPGPADIILYPTKGSSYNWAYTHLGVKYSYIFELRSKTAEEFGFHAPVHQIQPTADETWVGIKTLADSIME